MIDELDAALAELLRTEALGSLHAEVVFDAPDLEWATRRTRPTVNAFLYDLREDVDRRGEYVRETRDGDRRIVARRRPPRWFTLSYLVTAWARRIEDEHRLLTDVLLALLRHETLPPEYTHGTLAEIELPVLIGVNPTPLRDRSTTEIWSTLGGQVHPALELGVTIALDPSSDIAVAGPVTEAAHLRARRGATSRSPAKQVQTTGQRRVPARDRIEEP